MTKEQLIKRKNEYLDWELGVFFHFGIPLKKDDIIISQSQFHRTFLTIRSEIQLSFTDGIIQIFLPRKVY